MDEKKGNSRVLEERIRGNHAWNTCDGGVRGLAYSPERIKELVDKKHKKNYWKIGAMLGGGIAVLLGGLLYFANRGLDEKIKTQVVETNIETLPEEETLRKFAPKIEYYGVPEHWLRLPSFALRCEHILDAWFEDQQEQYSEYSDKLNKALSDFCAGSNKFIGLLSCKIEICKETDDNNNCVEYEEKEKLGIERDSIFDVKGVVMNDQYPLIELTVFHDVTIEEVYLSLTYSEDYLHDVLPRLLNSLLSSGQSEKGLYHFPLRGDLRLIITTNDRIDYEDNYEERIERLIEDKKVRLVLSYEDSKKMRVYDEIEDLKEVKDEVKDILTKIETEFTFDKKREFTLFSFSVDKRSIILTPDQSKSPEENIAAMYDIVDGFRTFLDYTRQHTYY